MNKKDIDELLVVMARNTYERHELEKEKARLDVSISWAIQRDKILYKMAKELGIEGLDE